MSAIDAAGVSVRLSGKWVVQRVDFSAREGQVSAIVGPNAAGKTTLLKALAGLIPAEGSIRYAETPLAELSAAERARRVAYVPQRSELSARLSVQQVVSLGRYAGRPGVFSLGSADRRAIDAALARVRAGALAERWYPELSGGEQRLVLLARALATGARSILLDEPALSLDIRHGLGLFELLRDLASQGYCIVCVLHDLDEVRRFCDAALLIEEGRARFAGAPEQADFVAAAEAVYGVRLVEHDRLGFRLPVRATDLTRAPDREPTPPDSARTP
jgi:iron complex transport system ATP-binding protein